MDMNMVFTDMTAQYRDISRFTGLSDQIPAPMRYVSYQNRIPILRHPDKMVLNVIDRMRTSFILAHWIPPTNDYSKSIYALKLFA